MGTKLYEDEEKKRMHRMEINQITNTDSVFFFFMTETEPTTTTTETMTTSTEKIGQNI